MYCGNNETVAGLVSFGLAHCGEHPGVYLKLTAYQDWLEKASEKLEKEKRHYNVPFKVYVLLFYMGLCLLKIPVLLMFLFVLLLFYLKGNT